MGQSLVKNYLHIVFSTKHRQEVIQAPVEEELHAYLGGICKNLECPPIKVGGYTDHVHILCLLSKKIALIKLMEELKSHSSKWMSRAWPSFGLREGVCAAWAWVRFRSSIDSKLLEQVQIHFPALLHSQFFQLALL
jgi:REP element-mobilizing transposase RayT